MLLVNVTSYVFHPVTEYKAIQAFEKENEMKDWVKSESTTGVAYTRTQRFYVELAERRTDDGD